MKIGTNIQTKESVKIDLNNLIETRMLISANSGGGKSYLARKILEESHGQVQQIVIDLEGEFSSLREKFDYLLVGKDGEIPANIRTADLLAKKLLELNVSTIIDLSELKHHERITFVKRFLDSLINSPKELWHNCLVFVDEAHHFCPQGTQSESTSAVIDLMTRGRKRGFCGVLSSQRISKLHKDACAEANNRLIGRTVLDIDRKRASEELGFTSKEQERSLRDLEAGEFYAFGTAISKNEIIKVKVGEVKTTHLKVGGKGLIKPSPTPENIKKILKNVIDLPKEAEKELREVEDFKKEVRDLRYKLTLAEKTQKVQERIQEKIINITDEKALQKAKDEGFKEAERVYKSYITPIEQNTKFLRASILKLVKDSEKLLQSKAFSMVSDMPSPKVNPVNTQSNLKTQIKTIPVIKRDFPVSSTPKSYYNENLKLKAGAIRMLKAVSMFDSVSRERVKTIAGVSNPTTFSTYIQALKRSGFINEQNRMLNITSEGIDIIGEVEELPTDTLSLVNMWSKFIKSGAIRMLNVCVECYPNSINREELRLKSNIENPTTFSTYLQDLKRNGLITIEGSEIKASKEFFI